MKKILLVAGLIVAALLLMTKCGDTVVHGDTVHNYYGPDWVEENAFAEDSAFTADGEDTYVPLEDIEEWATECGLLWPVDAWFICTFNSMDEPIGPCQLDWDHESCVASCFTSTHGFDNATVDTISTNCEQTPDDGWAPGCDPPWPDGTGVTCTIPEENFFVDFCELVWDKGTCTASCWLPEWSSFKFEGATPEAVSSYCHPVPAI